MKRKSKLWLSAFFCYPILNLADTLGPTHIKLIQCFEIVLLNWLCDSLEAPGQFQRPEQIQTGPFIFNQDTFEWISSSEPVQVDQNDLSQRYDTWSFVFQNKYSS